MKASGIPAAAALAVIAGYRNFISPMLTPSCRYYPSCSAYAAQAIERFGIGRGGWLAVRRLLRCHPWHRGGHDPVPASVVADTESFSSAESPGSAGSSRPTEPSHVVESSPPGSAADRVVVIELEPHR